MKKIGFIIPCYNQVELTKKCVNSIINNTQKKSYEFIFINNGSTDSTLEYLRSIPDAEIINNQTNLYVNPAWNQGFKLLLKKNLDYCGLLNNDIEVGTNWLREIFSAFEKRNGEVYIPASNMPPKADFDTEAGFYDYQNSIKNKLVSFSAYPEPFPGWCLLMKAEHVKFFYPIPDDILVLRGDDWIFDNLFNNGVVPTKCSHCVVKHVNSATQRAMSNLHNIRTKDVENFTKIEKELYPKRNMRKIWEKMPFGRMI